MSNKRQRFSYDDDIVLLKEIVSRNPFANGKEAWCEVKNSFSILTQKDFTIKSIRQHFQMLIGAWKKKDTETQKSSGIEEPYCQKDHLLQEAWDLMSAQPNLKIKKVAVNDMNVAKDRRINFAKKFFEEEKENLGCFIEHDYCADEPEEFLNDIELLPEDVTTPATLPEDVATLTLPENMTTPATLPEDVATVFTLPENKAAPSMLPKKMAAPSSSGATEPRVSIEVPSKKCQTPVRSILTPNVLGSIKSKARKTSYIRKTGLDFLQQKNKKDVELEEKRINCEEKKLKLEEKRKKK
ncbi:uncharacterized protein LOC114339169 [Diabrotica virgifera virgifera]|uniref:Uncharacterized protein LOC114339169 n=1 Tax=Diabrotica virgifera virgifera TaxID=50390 RepID=A0A6P7GPA0_DIAVI|nr:uncharacterized protein LOC114339169 [Diabrotica virgifera virgifera]